MNGSLGGQWCLVLGVSSGMGRAVAQAMAREGVHVAGVHFDTAQALEKVEVLAEELRACGVRAHFLNANAASAKTRADLLPTLVDLAGATGIKVFLHSLAFGSLTPFLPQAGRAPLTCRQLDMTLNVMANSLVYWTQDLYSAGLLRRGSKIFAMTSAGDQRVSPNYGAVSAAKCALESHVRQLAVELAPDGVAVNALRAGVTLTPSLERIPEHDAIVDLATRTNPHGRLTRAEDVADAVVLLSRTASSWLTGNVIGIDGGEALTA